MRTFLHILACTLLLLVGCTSTLGFRYTNNTNDSITEVTQGLTATLELDPSTND